MKCKPSDEVNPIVLVKLVCGNTGITVKKLLSQERISPLPFARSVLTHAFHVHAGYSKEGASQCVGATGSIFAQVEIMIQQGGKDRLARRFLPKCNDALDYSRIMYERALKRRLPKHRRIEHDILMSESYHILMHTEAGVEIGFLVEPFSKDITAEIIVRGKLTEIDANEYMTWNDWQIWHALDEENDHAKAN